MQALLEQLDSYDIFCRSGVNIEDLTDDEMIAFEKPVCDSPHLISLATKDVASADVVRDLMEAKTEGTAAVVQNIQDRLDSKQTEFFGPMRKKNLKTFASMDQITVKSKEKTRVVTADRKLLERLLTVANTGRFINIGDVMKHELSQVPLSLARTGGTMNTTTKSDLMNVIFVLRMDNFKSNVLQQRFQAGYFYFKDRQKT